MEISKVYQAPELPVVSAQSSNAQQAGENHQVAEAAQQDFQVDLQDGLKIKLAEFATILQTRQELIQSLPENIRKAVVELLEQMSAENELPQGLEKLLKGQKNAADKLKEMSTTLDFSAVLYKDEQSEVKDFVQQVFEKFTQQTEKNPEQTAKELVQLAKQLLVSSAVPQGDLGPVLEQLLEQTLPENMQQLTPNEQKVIVKLTNLLGQDMPAQLQQLVKQNNLPELPRVWAILKMVDAWQFREIQPKTLQAAAELLKQIAQEMSPEKGVMVTQLEQFVKSLPAEISNKGAVVARLAQFIQSLPSEVSDKGAVVAQLTKFVQALSPGINNKTAIAAQLAQFIQSLAPEIREKGTVVTQLEQFVQSLPSEVGNKGAVVSQLEQFIQSLPSEVSNKGTVVAQLVNFVQSLSPEINNKTAVTAQLAQFIQSLPHEVRDKGTVVTQLEQFVQSLPSEISNKGTLVANLEQFIKTLPPEIGKALEQALQQKNIPDSLRALADAFSNAVVLNENMSSDLQAFAEKNIEKLIGKFSLIAAETNNVLLQVAKQFTATNTTIEQLKTLLAQLNTQMITSDPKLLTKEQHILEQITKLFEPNIPTMLQEGGGKHNLPELPKMWVLLKALGTQPWQDIENQTLQKSAGLVKELAQSIYKSTGLVGEKQAEHSTLSFSIPLQVAEGIYYPAHIHIYHEQKESSSQLIQREFETWLRVSVDTKNLGMVDSVFRLYGDNKLDIRVTFPILSAVHQFTQDLPDVRKSFENSKLKLTDVMVNKV